MGIGFVFIIYLIVLAVVALPATLACAGVGYYVARKKSKRTMWLFVLGGGFLPILGAVYLVICIIVIGLVNIASGHDIGFGDGFELPLHNQYHWSAIDETTSAMIYDARDKRVVGNDGFGLEFDASNRDAFYNVLDLQEEGDWLAGDYSEQRDSAHPSAKQEADHWFLFNTRTHERIDADSEKQLKAIAAAHGIQLRLQSSDDFYSSRHLTWIDGMTVLALLIPPLAALFFLWSLARKLWRNDSVPV